MTDARDPSLPDDDALTSARNAHEAHPSHADTAAVAVTSGAHRQPDAAPLHLAPGTALLGRYHLGPEIGRGGMGAVYRARDTELDRDVAVKVLGRATGDAHACERLKREARAAAALNHPGIVAVHDVGEEEGAPFIVMELVDGMSLRQHDVRGVEVILSIAKQLCAALEHIHAHGVVHRDLKPENVLVYESSDALHVKITDLGVALTEPDARITVQGAIVGTAAYLAPEQALGSEVDGRADLYALGVILYELLTGRPPFRGDNALAVISQHLHAPVVPPRTLCSDVSEALEHMVMKLLAKDPNDRFANAAEVNAALPDLLGGTGTAASDHVDSVPFLGGLVRGRLVGRDEELEALRQIWQRSTAGHGQIALVSGEPGAGKTRLARELTVVAQLAGATVLSGGCYEYEATTPYLPFVEALRYWVHRTPDDVLTRQVGAGAAELARLAPELIERVGPVAQQPPLAPQEERLRLFDHIARFLQTLAQDRPVLVIFEDLHWADGGTIALLHYVLRQLRDDRLMVLGTYREVELDRVHPLSKALVDWDREHFAVRVPLTRLSADQTAALLATLLGQETVTDAFATAIFKETEGNPFFIEETVKTLIDQGQIEHRTGEWFLSDDIAELAIPQSVRAAISRRLDRLSEECTTVLHTAAAIGKTFDFDELVAVTAHDEDTVLDALDEAEQAQLVTNAGRDAFVFTHDKIREVLYEELNPIRMRRLHRRIAAAIEQMYPDALDHHAKDLAHHFVESGELEQGATWSTTAARQSAAVFAHDDAVRYYTRAIDCAEDLNDPERVAQLQLEQGLSHIADGDMVRATECFEHGLERTQSPELRIKLQSFVGESLGMLGDPRGRKFVEPLIETLDPDTNPVELARAILYTGRFEHYDGNHDAAREHCERALEIALEAGANDIALRAFAFIAGALQHRSRFPESNVWAERCIEYGRKHNVLGAVAMGHEYLAENAACQGRWDLAIDNGITGRTIGTEIHSRDRMIWGDFCCVIAYGALGRLNDAVALARRTYETAEEINEIRLTTVLSNFWATHEFELGNVDRALAIVHEALERADESGQLYLRLDSRRALGYIEYRLGHVDKANTLFAEITELNVGDQSRNMPLFAGGFASLALLDSGRIDAARRQVDKTLAIAESGAAPHYGTLARRTLAMILAAEGNIEAALDEMAEVVESFKALQSVTDLCRTYMMRSSLHEQAGRTVEQRADLQAAIDLMESSDVRFDLEDARSQLAALDDVH